MKKVIILSLNFYFALALTLFASNQKNTDQQDNYENIEINQVSNSKYIKGVNSEQWEIIEKIGDPLNCRDRIKKLNSITEGNVISLEDFKKDNNIIRRSLESNEVTFLTEGSYDLIYPLYVGENRYLIGKGLVTLNAKNTYTAIKNSGFVKNIQVFNAGKFGIALESNSTIYQVFINKTGIGHPKNSKGNGIRSRGKSSHSNCVVSVESAFGYNEVGNSSSTKKGGNADGFIVNHHAHNITFIDVHAHNNSDDGFDFWKGGLKNEKNPNEPTIRIFYSSANQNGKNPFTLNKDGMGFKFGSWDQYEKYSGKDEGVRLIYGSVACYNKRVGFDRNRTSMKILAGNLSASGNRKNYNEVWINSDLKFDDKYVLKCSMFPKKYVSVNEEFFNSLSLDNRKLIQTNLLNFGYNSTIDGIWGKRTTSAVEKFVEIKKLENENSAEVIFKKIISLKK